MKKKKFYLISFLNMVLIVLNIIIIVSNVYTICVLKKSNNQIEVQKLASNLESNDDIQMKESTNTSVFKTSADIMDQVSLFISICTGGIALFGIFGVVVTYLNVQKNDELEEAIRETQTTLETQKELVAWRWVQEGRYYQSLKKYAYAKSCFEQAEAESGDLIVHCIASFHKQTLEFDVFPIDSIATDSLSKIIEQINILIKDLEKQPKKLDRHILLQEIYFQQGCLYGSYAKKIHQLNSDKFKESIANSIKFLREAIKLDSNNADFKRNLSISYILAGNAEKAFQSLKRAQDCIEYDQLYTDLLSTKRLSALFSPYLEFINPNLRNKLKQEFGIIC